MPLAVDHHSHERLLARTLGMSDDMPVGQNVTNPGLENLQALLYRLITAPEGVAAGLAAERAPGRQRATIWIS